MISRRHLLAWLGAVLVAPAATIPTAKRKSLEATRKAEYIEKSVRPPMGAVPTLKNQPVLIMEGHITYMSTPNFPKQCLFLNS